MLNLEVAITLSVSSSLACEKTEILREYETRVVLVSEDLPPFRRTTADDFSALTPLQHLS